MRTYRQCPVGDGEDDADYAVVFIGGFVDFLMGVSWRLYRDFEGFESSLRGIKGYYHWDGGAWGMLADGCLRIADDLNELLRKRPNLNLVLIGHSYGGSAAMEVARHLPSQREGKLVVLTLDAVSHRQSSERAPGVDFWGNAYLSRGGGLLDVVPRIGGRWGNCDGADVNLSYDGYARDQMGNLHSHRYPRPMLTDTPDGEGYRKSLLALAQSRLEE